MMNKLEDVSIAWITVIIVHKLTTAMNARMVLLSLSTIEAQFPAELKEMKARVTF